MKGRNISKLPRLNQSSRMLLQILIWNFFLRSPDNFKISNLVFIRNLLSRILLLLRVAELCSFFSQQHLTLKISISILHFNINSPPECLFEKCSEIPTHCKIPLLIAPPRKNPRSQWSSRRVHASSNSTPCLPHFSLAPQPLKQPGRFATERTGNRDQAISIGW